MRRAGPRAAAVPGGPHGHDWGPPPQGSCHCCCCCLMAANQGLPHVLTSAWSRCGGCAPAAPPRRRRWSGRSPARSQSAAAPAAAARSPASSRRPGAPPTRQEGGGRQDTRRKFMSWRASSARSRPPSAGLHGAGAKASFQLARVLPRAAGLPQPASPPQTPQHGASTANPPPTDAVRLRPHCLGSACDTLGSAARLLPPHTPPPAASQPPTRTAQHSVCCLTSWDRASRAAAVHDFSSIALRLCARSSAASEAAAAACASSSAGSSERRPSSCPASWRACGSGVQRVDDDAFSARMRRLCTVYRCRVPWQGLPRPPRPAPPNAAAASPPPPTASCWQPAPQLAPCSRSPPHRPLTSCCAASIAAFSFFCLPCRANDSCTPKRQGAAGGRKAEARHADGTGAARRRGEQRQRCPRGGPRPSQPRPPPCLHCCCISAAALIAALAPRPLPRLRCCPHLTCDAASHAFSSTAVRVCDADTSVAAASRSARLACSAEQSPAASSCARFSAACSPFCDFRSLSAS